MNEYNELKPETRSFFDNHRFLVLIVITVGISLFLVGVSMALYTSSGTAQLDLSRPGYRAVSDQAAIPDKDFENFAAYGQLDKAAIVQFDALYTKQAAKAKTVDAFSGDPLNPDVLELTSPVAVE